MMNSIFYAMFGALLGVALFKGKAMRIATTSGVTAWYARG